MNRRWMLALVVILTMLGTVPARAGPASQRFDLPVYALTCARDPGTQAEPDFIFLGVVPPGCTRAAGVAVTLTEDGGGVVGSCTTGADGRCSIPVTVGQSVVVTVNAATVPAGYVPLIRPASRQVIAQSQENVALIINVPPSLPGTGAADRLPGALAVLVVSVLLLMGGYALQRRGHAA
jgi:hypothetical protein